MVGAANARRERLPPPSLNCYLGVAADARDENILPVLDGLRVQAEGGTPFDVGIVTLHTDIRSSRHRQARPETLVQRR